MRTLRALARRAHHGVVAVAAAAERVRPADEPLAHPPILIVGPPRSGTTLLHQVLVAGLDVGWFSGWHNVAAGAPRLVPARLQSAPATHFSSDHGRLASLREPHEAATWWYRFFPRDPHAADVQDVDPQRLRALRSSMAAVIDRADRPVVWKNVVNSVRLDPILEAVPEAIVVEVRRDAEATAASILRARESQTGSTATWWSVEPPEIASLRRVDPTEQALGQVAGVRDALDRVRATRPETMWIDVAFGELAEKPRDIVDTVGKALAEISGVDRRRSSSAVPERFAVATAQPTS